MEEALRRIERMKPDGELNLSRLGLVTLPPLPPTVKILHCTSNRLKTLPPLPEGLEELHCYFNSITELPHLPTTLRELACSHNLLTQLPDLPKNLQVLACNNNRLVRLPPLPNHLRVLWCFTNQLRTLPILPISLELFDCSGNPLEPGLQSLVDIFEREKPPPLIMMEMGEDPLPFLKIFIHRVNTYLERKKLKEGIIAARFEPRKIQRNMNRNRVDPEGVLSEENWEKYFTRRGEVWTEGVGRQGGKRKTRRRKITKRKTRKV